MDNGQASAGRALDIEALKTACIVYTEAKTLCKICNHKFIKNMCAEVMNKNVKDIVYYTEKLGGYVK